MLNFILPILKNPLTRIVADKTIGAIQHKMEKNKIIRAKEIEAEKSVSIEQIKQQEHSIKDELLTIKISLIFLFLFLRLSKPLRFLFDIDFLIILNLFFYFFKRTYPEAT